MGVLDRKAQIRSLGSLPLYMTNQGVVESGAAVSEQLATKGISSSELDLVLLSHLDCDHANGLRDVAAAKQILVSNDELKFAQNGTLVNRIRYNADWWAGTKIQSFDWNGSDGPAGRSYDVFGDGSLVTVNTPGHSKGHCVLKITNGGGKFVLMFADGGYAKRSWEELITSGIADDKAAFERSLEWIRTQSLSADCVALLANHDTGVQPHVIEFQKARELPSSFGFIYTARGGAKRCTDACGGYWLPAAGRGRRRRAARYRRL